MHEFVCVLASKILGIDLVAVLTQGSHILQLHGQRNFSEGGRKGSETIASCIL